MISVAIDGPAGAGKSTVAKAAARQLNFIYVDTGALYRAIGLYMTENKIATDDADLIISKLPEIKLMLGYARGEQRIFLNGRDVSAKIRKPEMSMAASNVSAIFEVRDFLLDLQRDMAKRQNVIMDGRDIGTVVLPHAEVKIFLTATPEARAKRRFEELTAKGENVSCEDVLAEMKTRDHNDANRKVAPLKQAPDAILIDTTDFTLEESVAAVVKVIKGKSV